MVLSMGKKWGDDDDDFLPPRQETSPDENGVRTITEWKFNADGKKVKVTKKVKKVVHVTRVSKAITERRGWKKFGAALNGQDSSNVTYMSNEEVSLEDPNADMAQPGEKKEDENIFAGLKNSSIVVCRHCGMVGDHWTLKCPYKDTPKDEIPDDKSKAGNGASSSAFSSSIGLSNAFGGAASSLSTHTDGKYVPPRMRGSEGEEGSGAADSMDDRDIASLRVTNISTDTTESDLQDLFRPFGPVARVYLAKDRETSRSRGFAFVSYVYREDAARALEALQGYGYDHLILKLEWAKPSTKEDAGKQATTFRSGYGKALPQNVAPPPSRR